MVLYAMVKSYERGTFLQTDNDTPVLGTDSTEARTMPLLFAGG